jgi:Na+/H+ antiporter NhaC
MYRLSPLILFLLLYLGTSTLLRDFYSVPIAVAFLLSAIYSLITPVGTYKQRLAAFTSGVGDSTVGLMLLIFILSGAFAATAKTMGAVDSTVNMTLQLMPRSLLLPGIFIASCFISFSIGTSCGTIAALTPVAVGLATATGVSVPLMVGLVVGGTYFGDNLSFISDTTIIATQTQGCRMRDKFLTNIRIVMPCALLLMIVYYFIGRNIEPVGNLTDYSFLKILPYLCVIALALMGVDVIIVLVIGLFSTFLIGTLQGSFTPLEWLHKVNDGILGMAELILCTLLASGMLAVIRDQGGIKYIITKITRHVSGSRGAEMAIAMLVFLVNICTANNTVAIITVGSISHEIAERFGIDPRRSASILDTMSCFAQGILPYGAQVLIAAGLASINPVEIIPYLYYPVLIGIAVIVTILMKRS